MTMEHETHPHDERLAALAGADPEATDDRSLRDHVAGCDRCRAVVDDLALLRSALAELPDLRPSRPLQLLPPVATPAAPRGGVLGRLRRLSAPALAAGAALILVGAVGSTGILEGFASMGAAGAPVYENVGENLGAAAEATSPDESARASDAAMQPDLAGSDAPVASPGSIRGVLGASPSEKASPSAPSTDGREDGDSTVLSVTSDPLSQRLPWLAMLGVGVALLAASLLLRFTVQPRAD